MHVIVKLNFNCSE